MREIHGRDLLPMNHCGMEAAAYIEGTNELGNRGTGRGALTWRSEALQCNRVKETQQ